RLGLYLQDGQLLLGEAQQIRRPDNLSPVELLCRARLLDARQSGTLPLSDPWSAASPAGKCPQADRVAPPRAQPQAGGSLCEDRGALRGVGPRRWGANSFPDAPAAAE